MVEHLLRLKLTLLANRFRRGPLRLAGVLLAVLYGLALLGVAVASIAALRSTTPEVSRAIVIVIGSLVVLAFLLLPLVFGVDDAIDPRRFALFGISTGKLALGLAVAALVSVPSLVIAVLAAAQVVAWSADTTSTVVAVVGGLLIIATCVLAARVSAAVAASALSTRRGRDTSGIALVLVLAVLAPLLALAATVDWQSQVLPVIRRIAVVAQWTPLGAAWSAPGDAALGNTGTAVAKLAIALGFVLLLALAWRGLVGLLLVRRERQEAARNYVGLGWFEGLPATPFGAIAGRSLSYWGRDARYRVSLAVIPIVPILMVGALLVAGVPVDLIVWIPVPVMCLFLGWMVHNDVAHDSSAFWVHVSANTRGADDRWGRALPALLLGVPLIAIGCFVTVLVGGDSGILPGLVGLSVGVLGVALGVSSVISAGFPYPAVRPGDSPFAQPQASGGSVVQSLSILLILVLSAPVVALLVLEPGSGYLALGLGFALGVGVLVGGVYWGGHIVNRRAPELLAFTLQN